MSTWAGRTVVLLGGGPSLRGFDFTRLRGSGAVVVAINEAALSAPWADACLTIDTVWLQRRSAFVARFSGEAIAIVPRATQLPPGATRLDRDPEAGLSFDARRVMTGGNSGFAALGLAMMRGAARIALLGYDMTGPGHWHGGYDWRSRYGVRNYPQWSRAFRVLADEAAARGFEIVNFNPHSAIACFPQRPRDEVVEWLRTTASTFSPTGAGSMVPGGSPS